MNPFARILVSLGVGIAIIASLVFFTMAGLAIVACLGIWYLIRRLRGGNANGESNSWFHCTTIHPDGQGGYVRTETGNMPQDGDVVDISSDEYREVSIETEQRSIEENTAPFGDKPKYC